MQSTGYGLVGRELRNQVEKTFLTAFALKTLVDGAVFRQYPGEFTVWSESEGRRAAALAYMARSGRRPTTSTRSSTADPSATATATARASCASSRSL